MAQNKGRLSKQVGPGVSTNSDRVDVFAFDSANLETATDGDGWESGEVLHAAESLFLQRGDQLAIADEDGGGIAVIDVNAEDVHEFRSLCVCHRRSSCIGTSSNSSRRGFRGGGPRY